MDTELRLDVPESKYDHAATLAALNGFNDKKAPQYVKCLDDAITVLFDSHNALGSGLNDAGSRLVELQTHEYSDIPGVKVEDISNEPYENRIQELCDRLGLNIMGLKVNHNGDKETIRKVEDVTRKYQRLTDDLNRQYQDRDLPLERAKDDLVLLVNELTDVTALSPISHKNRNIHVYVVNPEGVYEFHADFEEDRFDASGFSKTNIPVEKFDDPKFLEQFKAESQKVSGVNAYLVRNPSKYSDNQGLLLETLHGFVHDAMKSVLKDLIGSRTDDETPKSELDTLLDRLRKSAE